MNERFTLIAGAALGAFGVALGAFGAHAFKSTLVAHQRLDTYDLAVRYHFYHALALLIIGLLMSYYPSVWLRYSSLLIFIGTLIFSGSLYVLSLTGLTILGAVTPVGGIFLIGGWVCLLVAVFQKK